MDEDKAVGIQKLEYLNNTDITENLKRYQYVMWAADFSESDPPNAAFEVKSKLHMKNEIFYRNVLHQVLLRANVKDDSLLTDDYECVFLQAGFHRI